MMVPGSKNLNQTTSKRDNNDKQKGIYNTLDK